MWDWSWHWHGKETSNTKGSTRNSIVKRWHAYVEHICSVGHCQNAQSNWSWYEITSWPKQWMCDWSWHWTEETSNTKESTRKQYCQKMASLRWTQCWTLPECTKQLKLIWDHFVAKQWMWIKQGSMPMERKSAQYCDSSKVLIYCTHTLDSPNYWGSALLIIWHWMQEL